MSLSMESVLLGRAALTAMFLALEMNGSGRQMCSSQSRGRTLLVLLCCRQLVIIGQNDNSLTYWLSQVRFWGNLSLARNEKIFHSCTEEKK